MRDRVGALGTRLGKVKGAGEDSDRLLCGLEGAWGETSYPSSWMRTPVVDADGNLQNEELSTEVKNALKDVSLSLHNSDKVLPCWEESLRSSACTAAQSKTVALSWAPAGEWCGGVSCGEGGALGGAWPGGWCLIGEPCGSGLLCLQKRSQVGISEEEPPSALLDGRGSELELSCPCFVLSTPLHAHPKVFLSDETKCVFFGRLKPAFSEQTEYKKMLSRVKSTSADLQITLGLLALPALGVANPLHRS